MENHHEGEKSGYCGDRYAAARHKTGQKSARNIHQRLVLQLLSFISENERTTIRQRQAEGIAAAKKRGVRFGRPTKEAPPDFDEIIAKWQKKEMPLDEILRQYGMSESKFYRRLRERKAMKRGKR